MKTIKPRGTHSIITGVSDGIHPNYEPYKRYLANYCDDTKFEKEAKKLLEELGYTGEAFDRELPSMKAKIKEAHYNQVQLDKFFGITK